MCWLRRLSCRTQEPEESAQSPLTRTSLPSSVAITKQQVIVISTKKRSEKKRNFKASVVKERKFRKLFSLTINHILKLSNFVIGERGKRIGNEEKSPRQVESNEKSFNEIAADVASNYFKQFSLPFFKKELVELKTTSPEGGSGREGQLFYVNVSFSYNSNPFNLIS